MAQPFNPDEDETNTPTATENAARSSVRTPGENNSRAPKSSQEKDESEKDEDKVVDKGLQTFEPMGV